MTVVRANESEIFSLPGVTFRTLVSASRGGSDNAVWRVTIAPDTPGQIHQLTSQEVIHILAGKARVSLAGTAQDISAGDTIVVPPLTDFSLENRGPEPLEAISVLRKGGQAIIADAAPFTPPWAS